MIVKFNATFRSLQGLSSERVISSCTAAAGGGHAMIRMLCCDATKTDLTDVHFCELYDSGFYPCWDCQHRSVSQLVIHGGLSAKPTSFALRLEHDLT